MSIRPHRFFASAIIIAIADSLVTSASKAKQSPPACRTIAAVSSASLSSRSTDMTFAPSCANRSAVARPLPMPVPGLCPAPTMIAVFDSSRMSGHDENPSKGKQRARSASGFADPAGPGSYHCFRQAIQSRHAAQPFEERGNAFIGHDKSSLTACLKQWYDPGPAGSAKPEADRARCFPFDGFSSWPDMRLESKTAIIVGAGQSPGTGMGNGRATALRFAQEGAKVMSVDRELRLAEETAAMVRHAGGDCFAFEADVTRESAMAAMIAEAKKRWGRIDVLHYNVGVSIGGGDAPLLELTEG